MELSINIAFYNETPEQLRRCIDSVAKIRSIDYEILLIDDGSTNQTLEELDAYLQSIVNLRIVTQQNKGLSCSRNFGIKLAKGNIILCIDSDDWINPSTVELAYKRITQCDLDLCGYMHQATNEQEEVLSVSQYQGLLFNTTVNGCSLLKSYEYPVSTWSYLMRRDLLIKNQLFFYPGITHQDVEHNVRLMLYAQNVQFIDKVGYYYNHRLNSITKPKSQEKLKKLLFDEIIVATQIKENTKNFENKKDDLHNAIVLKFNSVVWNLLWRFVSNPKEVDYEFKLKCLDELKRKKLYPIQGSLKTPFQKVSTWIFNREALFKLIVRLLS